MYMQEAIQRHRDADAVLFCGDGADDIAQMQRLFPETAFYSVRGNCDFGCAAPLEQVLDLGGARILMAHGHTLHVKFGLWQAKQAAREKKANLLLFGHTHEALSEYDDGLYIVNPGSISGYAPTYAVIDVSEKGLLVKIMRK